MRRLMLKSRLTKLAVNSLISVMLQKILTLSKEFKTTQLDEQFEVINDD